MTHGVVIGGGGAIAQTLIEHWLDRGWFVSAVCRTSLPCIEHERLTVYRCVDLCTWKPNGSPTFVDAIVTLPGLSDNAKIENMTGGQWQSVIDSNMTAVFNPIKQLIPRLNGNANIVVVGSIVGSLGGYGCANYAAAKAGLKGFVKAAANELGSRGIVVNLLELGYVNAGMGEQLDEKVRAKVTETIPMRRFAHPKEVAQAIHFLAEVRYMTGNVLTFAGGL